MAYLNASGEMDNNLGLIERYQTRKVVISAAQIQAMNGTPVSILPIPTGPQPNLVYYVESSSIQFTAGSVQFTGGGAVSLVYHGTSTAVHASSVPAATVNSASSSNNFLPQIAAVIQPPTNTGIDITNATAAFAAGNGYLTVKVRFVVQVVD